MHAGLSAPRHKTSCYIGNKLGFSGLCKAGDGRFWSHSAEHGSALGAAQHAVADEEPSLLRMRPTCVEDPSKHAGLVAEDLEPLQLSKDQHLALLNMLLQTRRMRLVMSDGRRTYALPR